jgi:hypothetical protein
MNIPKHRLEFPACDSPGLADTGCEPLTQAGGRLITTNEKRNRRTLDHEFIHGVGKLVSHGGYSLAAAVGRFLKRKGPKGRHTLCRGRRPRCYTHLK